MNEPDNMSTFISDFKTATYHFKTSIFGGQIDKVNKSLENLENASYSDNVKDKLDALDNSIKEVKNFMSTRGADSSKSQWVEALGGRLEESKKMLLEKSSYTKDGKDYTLQSGLKEGLGNLKVDINNFDKTLDDAKLNAKNLMQLSDPKSEFVWSVLSSKKIGDDVNDRLNSIINVVSEKYPKLKPEQQLALSKKINDGLLEGLPNKRSEDGNSFTVDGKNYKVIKQLGEGGMGIAFLIQNEETGHKLVAKGFKSQDGFFEEIDAHNMATGKPEHEHTNVSKFHGATIDSKGNGFAFQEFADGGDIKHLQETIKKFTDNGILSHSDSVIVKQYLANQIVQGMIHVNETRDMVHMDIKPDNFMFDKTSGTVKVIDFGLAQKNDKPEFKGGTAGYIAPEFMDANNRRIDKVGDIWSIGTTIQELVTGTKVFDGPKMGQADQKAIDFAKSGKFLRNVKDTKGKEIGTEPTAIAKVINNMLSGKPEDRMKFSELAKQPYFTDPLGSEERAKGLLSKMLDVMAKETDTVKKDTPFDEKKDFLKTEFQRELTKIPH